MSRGLGDVYKRQDAYKQNRDPNKATSQDKKGKETKIATGAKRSGITTCKAGK